jgi:hypothetical protein
MGAGSRLTKPLQVVLAFTALLPGCGPRLQEYVSEKGGFRVRMPGEPEPDPERDLPRGVKKVTLLQRSGSWSVAWEDLEATKGGSDDQRLNDACDGALKKLKAKEVRPREITLAGKYPGRELVAEWPDGKGITHDRMYLVGNRLYQVVASGPKWWVESSTSKKVLDSFALLEE